MLCVQKANILLTLYMDVKLCFFFLSLFWQLDFHF
jgi:hypothetical protein